jgi:hypothetical protein
VVAARYNLLPIFLAMVFGRFFVFLSFLAMVLTKKAQIMLLIFGAVDALGAGWTLLTSITT